MEGEDVAVPGNGGAAQRADRAALALVTGIAREGGEVVLAEQGVGGAPHGGQIERQRHMPVGAEGEGVVHHLVQDEITVSLFHRIEPRVKGGRDEAAFHDADVARQIGVEGAQKNGGLVQARRVEGGDLAERMNAGVGAAGTLQVDFFTPQFGQRELEAFLHRAVLGLALPAEEIGAASRRW